VIGDKLFSLAYPLVLVLSFVSALMACYHLFFALTNIQGGWSRILAQFLGPLLLVTPRIFNTRGNHHRKRFILWLIPSAVLFTFLFAHEPPYSIEPTTPYVPGQPS
jgi:hypothetical protein